MRKVVASPALGAPFAQGPMPRRPGDTAKLPDSWSPPDRWGIRVPTFTPAERQPVSLRRIANLIVVAIISFFVGVTVIAGITGLLARVR